MTSKCSKTSQAIISGIRTSIEESKKIVWEEQIIIEAGRDAALLPLLPIEIQLNLSLKSNGVIDARRVFSSMETITTSQPGSGRCFLILSVLATLEIELKNRIKTNRQIQLFLFIFYFLHDNPTLPIWR